MNKKDLEKVSCILRGESDFVFDVVEFIGERLKFKGDVVKMKRDSDGQISAYMDILGFYCDKDGNPEIVKDFRAECVPDIGLSDN